VTVSMSRQSVLPAGPVPRFWRKQMDVPGTPGEHRTALRSPSRVRARPEQSAPSQDSACGCARLIQEIPRAKF
jgi:hypothetical protein